MPPLRSPFEWGFAVVVCLVQVGAHSCQKDPQYQDVLLLSSPGDGRSPVIVTDPQDNHIPLQQYLNHSIVPALGSLYERCFAVIVCLVSVGVFP